MEDILSLRSDFSLIMRTGPCSWVPPSGGTEPFTTVGSEEARLLLEELGVTTFNMRESS